MMQRALTLLSILGILAAPSAAMAGGKADKKGGKKEAPAPAPTPPADAPATIDMTQPDPGDAAPAPTPDTGSASPTPTDVGADEEGGGKTAKADKDLKLEEDRGSWADVVVVIRKPFLKANRLELVPTFGYTLNDNMIRHYEFEGQINYYLTDVLSVGLEGEYFVKRFQEPYDTIAREDRRLPTLNKYNFGAALDFHYAPIYAKFAVMNRKIVHWEAFFTAGVGFTQSEVLPRDPALPGWTNFLITPNVGFTTRVFLNNWITLDLGVKDYVFVDKFEPVNRTANDSLDSAMSNASSKLINHVVFQAGLSFWFPTSFRYTTFR